MQTLGLGVGTGSFGGKTGVGESVPPPTVPVNVPTISVSDAGGLTYLILPGDTATIAVTTSDSDGATTTGVSIYDTTIGLIGSATGGSGSWTYNATGLVSGDYTIFARRFSAGGQTDSSTWKLQSCYTPVNVFTSSGLQEIIAVSGSITHSAGAISQWNDTDSGAKHYTQATGTAQPAYHPADLSVGGNDQSLVNVQGGTLDYVRFDGTSDFMDSTLNLPAPGTTPNGFAMIVRINSWINLDRFFASVGTANVQILYMTPSSPGISMFNTSLANTCSLPNNPDTTKQVNVWMLVMGAFTNSTSDWLKTYNVSATGTNAGNSSATGRRLGQDVSGSRFGSFDIHWLKYFSVNPTTSQRNRIINYWKYKLPVGISPADGRIILEGDSIAEGTHGTVWLTQMRTRPKRVVRVNVAAGGETMANFNSQRTNQIVNTRNANHPWELAVLHGAVNDLVGGARLASAIYPDMSTWNTAVKAAGYLTAIGTLIPGGYTGSIGTPGNQLYEWDQLNTMILANSAGFDYVINFRDLMLGDPGDSVYYDDNFHPTTLGYVSLCAGPEAVVDSLSYTMAV